MKIQIMSDLHFEFGWEMGLTEHKDTTLVLAGDIDSDLDRLENFIIRACRNYEKVIMVAGNHEFYGNHIEDVLKELTEMGDHYENFYFLENGILRDEENKVLFLGGTLWADPAWGVFNRINDHNLIQYQGRKLLGKDITAFNAQTTWFLKQELEKDQEEDWKTVVVTHFGPDPSLMHPKWLAHTEMNTYFWATGLQDHFKYADYWFYGHTHDPGDEEIDDCRFICNPNGYVWPGGAGREHYNFDPELIMEI